MDMKEEMMNDAIDDVIGDEEDDEERLVLQNFLLEHARDPPPSQDVVIFNNDLVMLPLAPLCAHLPLPWANISAYSTSHLGQNAGLIGEG